MSPLAAFWLDAVSFLGAVAIVYIVGCIFARWTAIDDRRADQRSDYDWRHMDKHRLRFERAMLANVPKIVAGGSIYPLPRGYFGETVDVTPHDLPPFVLARAFDKHLVYVPIDFERVQPLQWAR